MRWGVALPGFALAGCNAVFGIDTLDDLTTETSTLRLTHMRATVTASFDEAFVDLADANPVVYAPDMNEPSGFRTIPMTRDADAADVFVAPCDPATAIVAYELPGDLHRVRHFGVPNESDWSATTGRDPDPPPPNAQFDLSIIFATPWVTGDSLSLHMIGNWANQNLPAPTMAGVTQFHPLPVPYRDATPINTSGTLAKIVSEDRVYVTRYRIGGGYTKLVESAVLPGFAQRDGVDTFAAAVSAPNTQSATIDFDPRPLFTRVSAVRGDVPKASWAIVASPAAEVSVAAGLPLSLGMLVGGETPLAVSYANPSEWDALRVVTVLASRNFQLPGAVFAYGIAMNVVQPVGELQGEAAPLPVRLTIANTPLLTEDEVVHSPPNAPIEISMQLDRSDPCDYYSFAILSVDRDLGTATRLVTINARLPTITVPSVVVPRDRLLLLEGSCVIGVPDIATGSMRSGTSVASSTLDAPPFTLAD